MSCVELEVVHFFRMNTSNAFGIVQAIVDLVMQYKAPGAEEEEEDEDGASSFAGKFLLLKEPSKSMIRLYAVIILLLSVCIFDSSQNFPID